MSEHQISLTEEVYCELLSAANADGISPADWIASQLSTASIRTSDMKSTDDLIGAIDSQHESNPDYKATLLGDAIANLPRTV